MHAVAGETTAGTVHLHPQVGEDWRTWPDGKAARAQLGLNAPQLSMYLRRGYVVQYKCPDGALRFSPQELEMLRLRIEQGSLAEVQDVRESNVELKDVLKHLVGALKQCQDHNERLFGMITEPISKGTGFLTRVVDQQAERLAHMERTYDQSIMTRESLLSLQHDRELQTVKVQNKQENVRHAIDRTVGTLGPLAQQILANLGISVGAKHPGLELLESLDPALVVMVYGSGALDAKQKKAIRELWPDLPWDSLDPQQPAAGATSGEAAAPQQPAPAAPQPAPAPAAAPTEPAEPERQAPPSSKPEPPSTAPARPPRRRRRKEGDKPK